MNGEAEVDSQNTVDTSNGGGLQKKRKVVVIMGPTGSGKSKLAIDLASFFPVEIINADSMQVYRGLDVLTNKVPIHEQNGVPHHLLGTISPSVEFTAKGFRDYALPIINDIMLRNRIPVLVGGTNYYIQAVVSPYLLDDTAMDIAESGINDHPGDGVRNFQSDFCGDKSNYSYDLLKGLDPVAANRIHPNNRRKINQYLSLYARTGILPSKLYQGKAAENWGNNLKFDCCFICVDAAVSVLDKYVEQRVDCMIDAGLLDEVYDIYVPGAEYTKGLRQAIGVREFEGFFGLYLSDKGYDDEVLKEKLRGILFSPGENEVKSKLVEAIDRVKLNTRRLVRRQKRRVNRLQTLFGWNIHFVDSTESISGKSHQSWGAQVVDPAVRIIKSFLNGVETHGSDHARPSSSTTLQPNQRDLWTQYVCEACGDRVLRGSYEWEQHKQGRGHRKRASRLKKESQIPHPMETLPHGETHGS